MWWCWTEKGDTNSINQGLFDINGHLKLDIELLFANNRPKHSSFSKNHLSANDVHAPFADNKIKKFIFSFGISCTYCLRLLFKLWSDSIKY